MTFHKALLIGFIILSTMLLVACAEESTPPTLDYHWSRTLDAPEGALRDAFIATGVGMVDLVSCEDGDTAEFMTENTVIRVRFIGVDTPEASHYFEPWGAEATDYACEALSQANTIVLESDASLTRVDTFGRHLGYVWVDGTLLNLRLIEQGWSSARGVASLRYGSLMQQANDHVQALGERIWSTHPTFSTQGRGEGTDVSLQTLAQNPEPYLLTRVNVEGVIVRILGDQAFLQEGEYGIFLYAGHGRNRNDRLAVGHRVRIEDAQFYDDLDRFHGAFLTDINNQANPSKIGTIDVLDVNQVVEAKDITLAELESTPSHTLVRLENLEVIGYEIRPSSRDFPHEYLRLKDLEGREVWLVQSDRVYGNMRSDLESISVGDILDVTAILAPSTQGTLLLLTDVNDLHLHE